MNSASNPTSAKGPKLVGAFIRSQREAMGLSQRALGLLLTPVVTTQFISNIERGVTPLPPAHVSTLCNALKIQEPELMALLEREYAVKLSERLGMPSSGTSASGQETAPSFAQTPEEQDFWNRVHKSYQTANPNTRNAFETLCENLFGFSKKS